METSDHLTTIYTTAKQYHIYKTLKTVLGEINSNQIIQINRKNCVNIAHIINEKRNYIVLDNNKTLKVGKSFKEESNRIFNEYIG